jgi:hypothetical protein
MNLPKELLLEAQEVSGAPTQTMAVILGLEELIRKKRLEKLASLKGSGAIKLSKGEQKALRK